MLPELLTSKCENENMMLGKLKIYLWIQQEMTVSPIVRSLKGVKW